MIKINDGPTVERLRELLSYDSSAGVFRWIDARPGVRRGFVAGCINHDGYRVITIDGRGYMAHRLAWLYEHGVWPIEEIDHKYGIRDDNRLSELREANHTQNTGNTRARRHNKTGLKGVSPARNGFQARIRTPSGELYLGYFNEAHHAAAAYRIAASAIFGDFAWKDCGLDTPSIDTGREHKQTGGDHRPVSPGCAERRNP